MVRFVAAALIAASLALPAVAQQTPPPPLVREITRIKDEVYRFRNNNRYSVFAVTSAGIIATDPINAPAATWLKSELKQRWPDRPIKFLRAQVLAAIRAGKSLEETRKSVDLSKYKDWGGFEPMSQLNIDGVYRLVQGTRRPN